MATKTYYATRDMRHPVYRTRMLKANEEVTDAGPLGPLFVKRGLLTTEKPKSAESENLESLTKAELAKRAGISANEAKKLTKADLIAKLAP